MTTTKAQTIPPTARTLLDALAASDGAILYSDPRVTISGLTGLRKSGLALVTHAGGKAWVLLTVDGRALHESASVAK
jgi:hypothetical protein